MTPFFAATWMPRLASLTLVFAALMMTNCDRQVAQDPVQILEVSILEPVPLPDDELNQAALEARQSFAAALAETSALDFNGTAFMAKIHIRESAAIKEDIWISSINPEPEQDGFYTGVVGDMPSTLRNLQMSDIVRFHLSQLVEWQYFERDQVRGATVSRILRSRMSEAKRAEFDASYAPFRFH